MSAVAGWPLGRRGRVHRRREFETRKQFSPRTSLSLLSEYDWYSWVPAMRYNDGDGAANGIVNQTHITDGDAFSERTSLRLNIGLGPSRLYAPQ